MLAYMMVTWPVWFIVSRILLINKIFILYSRACVSIQWGCIPRINVLMAKVIVSINGTLVRIIWMSNIGRV